MDTVRDLWDLFSTAAIFAGGAIACMAVGRSMGVGLARSATLYLWHTLLCLAYLAYALAFGADAVEYYHDARTGQHELQLGTSAVTFLTAAVVQTFQLSLAAAFLLFNILGSIGLQSFDASLREALKGNRQPALRWTCALLPLLPSISFWSSAIGKDSIAFMATGLALWGAVDLKRRTPVFLVAVVAMLLVRPHMAAMMVVALVLAVLVGSRLPLLARGALVGLSLVAAALLVPLALEYVGLGDDLSSAALEGYIEQRQGYNTEGDGGIELADMSPPLQVLTYMFRPTLLEARSVFFLAAAIDNTVLLVLFATGVWTLVLRGRTAGTAPVTTSLGFMWTYSALAWVSSALTTANLGIALRQKWMFAPIVIYLMVLALAGRHPGGIRGRIPRPGPAAP